MEYGIDAAVLLHNMVYWVQKNAAEGRHMHSGRYWTYNSVAGLHELFPVWTRAKLRRLLQKCEEDGLLLVGNYSDDPLDRTKWYSPSDKILCYYTGAPSICQNRQMHLPESALACAENSKCYNEQSLPKVTTPIVPPRGTSVSANAKSQRRSRTGSRNALPGSGPYTPAASPNRRQSPRGTRSEQTMTCWRRWDMPLCGRWPRKSGSAA